MSRTATVIKVQDAQPMGEYAPTAIDAQKQAACFLLVQVSPYVIRWASGGTEKVTAARLQKLQKAHTWGADF